MPQSVVSFERYGATSLVTVSQGEIAKRMLLPFGTFMVSRCPLRLQLDSLSGAKHWYLDSRVIVQQDGGPP